MFRSAFFCFFLSLFFRTFQCVWMAGVSVLNSWSSIFYSPHLNSLEANIVFLKRRRRRQKKEKKIKWLWDPAGCCYDEGQKLLCSCCQRDTLVGTGNRFILQQGQREAITICLHVPLKFNWTRSNISPGGDWHHASTSAPAGNCRQLAAVW